MTFSCHRKVAIMSNFAIEMVTIISLFRYRGLWVLAIQIEEKAFYFKIKLVIYLHVRTFINSAIYRYLAYLANIYGPTRILKIERIL